MQTRITQTFRIAVILGLAGVLSLSGYGADAQQTAASGITEPVDDSTLSTPVAGIIQIRRFKEGDEVKKGDVLVALDHRLEELDVQRRRAVMEQAKRELDATRILFQKNTDVAKSELEKRQLEFDVAKAEHELSAEQLTRRSIAAPFDGSIAEYFLNIGEACQIQQPLLRLVNTRHCRFISNVDAKAGRALKIGQSVDLEIDSGLTPLRLKGRVSFVSPVVDPASGLLKVKVVFDNLDGEIRPGVAGKLLF